MAKLTTLFLTVLITVQVWAQVPNTISYQAVIRNSNNELVANSSVGIQISILEGSTAGNEVYSETHSVSTNANGLVSLQIGAGSTTDDFSSINWGTNSFFIKTEIDVDGGSNYSLTAVSQLLSVPYALHAKTAESLIGGSLLVSNTIEDASSYNSEDGSISVSVAGGTTPYTYYWTRIHESEDDYSGDFSNTNSSSISGITPGYYELYVSDANNTSSLKRFRVNHTGPVVTLNEVTASCINFNSGSIDISVSGGTPPYTYKWTFYNEETWNEYNYDTEDLDNKASGSYRIKVTDVNGYTSESESYYIPQYNPDITFSYTPSCSLSGGEIIAEVNSSEDGVSFSYEWSDSYELDNILSENATLSGIGVGNYYLKVTNSEGCESRVVSTSLEPSFNPEVNANKTYPCSDNTNGAIDITLDYTGEVSYEWSEDVSFSTIISTEEDLVNISSGSYYLRLTNEDGCISSVKEFYLDENYFYLNISTETTNACSGNDGVFDISIANEGTYTFEWSDDSEFSNIIATTEDLTNLSVGSHYYYLRVTNEEGCKYTREFWIEIGTTFTPDISYTTNNICSGNDGGIDITITDVGTFTYEWSDDSEFSNIIATTEDLTNLSVGSHYYYLRVTNEEGCKYTREFWIEIGTTFTPDISYTTNNICSGNDGGIDITITDVGTFTYEWSDDSEFSNIIATTENLTNISQGYHNYYLRVTNEDGCRYARNLWFEIGKSFSPAISSVVTDACSGESNGAIDLTVDYDGTVTYEWSRLSDFSAIISTEQDLSDIASGKYYYRLTNEKGCIYQSSVYVSSFWANIESSINNATSSSSADGAVNIYNQTDEEYSYEWATDWEFTTIISTDEDLLNVGIGYYYLRVTNTNGCTDTYSYEIVSQ